jgi:hypothetical protein
VPEAGTPATGAADRGAAPPEKHPAIYPWIIGGVGVASLAASGVFFALRQSSISKLESACPTHKNCPPSLESTANSGKTYSTLSMVTLVVGVVGVGAGATLLIMGDGSGKSPEAALAFGAPEANAGASVLGKF